ncbi:cellulose 1,4-beta-cellobiosidase [Acrocarpospora pleiomorpha]|uniref:Cellulose 1,4-beta-cellobiosidase n=1 Tax=Acrocarpospora pleiomorpha TaxID=90975 RepID=A0A5M3XN99_9ACTN|nr:glycoside hydrolase family 48 protein [Acrocarpospora pleiomorpha]GES22805.1 cellulose 1,4-beta-cellobiosidase [Acrocarpospora pleiomorpha]
MAVATAFATALALATVPSTPANAAVACQVTYTKTWEGGNGFGAQVRLQNLGDPVSNWRITYTFPGNQTLQNGWEGTWSQSGANVTIDAPSWAPNLAANAVVQPGANFTFSGTNTNPTAFSLNGTLCTGPVATQALVVTPTSVNVPEGGTATYSVRLQSAPTANVTVTSTAATGGDANLTVSGGASLTFTPANFATPQNVTIAAAEDADTTNGTRTINVASAGLTTVAVTATEVDNDSTTTLSCIVTPTMVSVPEGGTATYSVRLNQAPTANVVVTSAAATGGDTNITVTGGASLTFTPANFATPQNVTLSAAQDADTTNGTRTINLTCGSGGTVTPITATEADDDPVTTQSLVVTPTSLSVPEGSTAIYSVRLAIAPTANVTVTNTAATGGDTNITVTGGASLTFTPANFATPQSVTLSAAQDADSTNGTRTITVASSGLTSVSVTATEADDENTSNSYLTEFQAQYDKLKASASGYLSPEGIPYHSIETLMVEAPDHGHETTSEAFSFLIWLEAQYGRVTRNWAPFNASWTLMENYIIPSAANQPGGMTSYNPADPADYAPEFNQPSQYPSPLSTSVVAGQDPLANELASTYGNRNMYAMHWLLDVDDVYGYGTGRGSSLTECGDNTKRVTYINTYQRGPQESVWETVPHPSCETQRYGQSGQGYQPLFIQGTAAAQWRYTAAPDADARAVQAAYWALTWATEQGNQSQVSATLTKAGKLGDYLRYAMYDKYFKNPGCASPTCTAGSGKSSSAYLLNWYFAWGGALDGAWSWRIGSSHNHGGYQNPLAAWALSAGPTAMRPQSPTAAADWNQSLTRQVQFYKWLQSAEGGIAGGATNSWDGAYAARPAGQPQFFGMTYDWQPVYHDPPSNQWFGFQGWGMQRLAELYYVTGNTMAKSVLDKWVAWAISQTTLGTGSNYQVPNEMDWSGAPSATFNSPTGTPADNPGLHVTVRNFTQDIGVTAAYARTLIYYAAKEPTSTLGISAKNTAKGLLDRMIMLKDARGIVVPETRADYNRFDDVWTSANQTGLYIPSGYSGVMPNGDTIVPGKSFLGIRSFYTSDPDWSKVQTYLNGGAVPTFTYHRFWAQADAAMALADYGSFFPGG